MTVDEFVEKLSATAKRYKWLVMDNSAIKTEDGQCPIEAVAEERGLFPSARKLGLSSKVRPAIVYASDGWGSSPLRTRLLAALGLKEPS